MGRVSYTHAAEDDLAEIWAYISIDNEEAADRLLRALHEQATWLADMPEAGRYRPKLGDRILSFPMGNYNIYYLCAQDGIEVIRVLHTARDTNRDYFS
ncbi:MAG: type II toxin-antitoxin system RelE/ParE family toxin [Candidatus Hydrogenedentes bacterium]|nr:type II toxin-antitoxin system RelE/ParE family toxin [Candidatus Hydrogenedentota bacterium]